MTDDADTNEPRFPDLGGAGATGGPYLTPAQARDVVLDRTGCTFAAPSSRGNTCSEVEVAFFSRYEDAWLARDGNNGHVVGGWAADHEVYVVTVKGSFTTRFTGKTGGRSGRGGRDGVVRALLGRVRRARP